MKRQVIPLILLGLLFSFSSAIKAASFTVTKTVDTADGTCNADCSLREAIIATNTSSGADIITLPAGVYTLTRTGTNENLASTGDLDISGPGTNSLTINGAGSDTTIIQASPSGMMSGIDRVFELTLSANATLSGVTIRFGYSGSTNAGGILVGTGSTLNLNNSSVSNNYSSYYGGGIYNSGTVFITNSTIHSNFATYGGGIANYNTGGGLTIKNSTFFADHSFTSGGAIYNFSKPLTILNSTIYGNSSEALATNIPGLAGVENHSGTVLIRNSIVSANTNAINLNSDCSGTMTVEDTLGCGNTPVTGIDTVLANNGGSNPTPSLMIFAGSNAIDAGNNATCETVDQRGETRPSDGDENGTATCDVGSIESNNTLSPPRITLSSISMNESSSGTTTMTFTLNRFGYVSDVSSVQYATSNGTATAGSDYVAVPTTTLTFNANETVKTIDVIVNGDIAPETNETFYLYLSSPTNATIRDPQGIGTLINDDNSVTISKTDDTNDGICDADCSLREAFVAANIAPGVQSINVPAGTYTLTRTGLNEQYAATGDLDTWENLIITGAGADTTIIQAGTTDSNGIDRVIDIFNSTLTMSGVTVRYGRVIDPTDRGGGINAESGSLNLTNVTVTSNRSGFTGGGIEAVGTVTLTNVLVSNNLSLMGGGIHATGPLIISGSTITGNTTTGTAGGFYSGGTLTLTNSTISNNQSNTGGGLYNGATGVISGSTFSGNIATGMGGAIFNYNVLTIKNSTLSGNNATSLGGGIYVGQSTLTVNNSTLFGNSAGTGGGINRSASAGTVIVRNTIIANSTGGDCAGSTITVQNSLGCGSTAATGIDPNLSNNGGATLIHALQMGSNAIDTGNNSTCETTDQRGVARPINGDGVGLTVCDIGAVEAAYQPPAVLTLNTPTAITEGDAGTTTLTFTVTRSGNTAISSTVSYTTADDTATASSDYVSASGILTFAPTVDAGTIDITINGDLDDESDETFTLTLSAPSVGTNIAVGQAVGTITDDDEPPATAAVTFSAHDLTTGEGAAATGYTVYLTSQPAAGENVTITAAFDSSQLLVTPPSQTLDSSNWNTGLTFSVSAVDDATAETSPLALVISHSVSSSNGSSPYNSVTAPSINVSLGDNDTAGIYVSSISGDTDENGTTATFTITLTSQPLSDVTIPLTSSNPAEGSVASAVIIPMGQWNTGVSVTVTGVNDDYVDGSVSYTIITGVTSSTDSTYNGLDPVDVAVVNGDNDVGVIVAPSTNISSTVTSPTASRLIPVTVTFSEAVTGFYASDLVIVNATMQDFSGSGNTYTFNLVPLAEDVVTVDIPADACVDSMGNGNTAASQWSIIYSVPVVPTSPADAAPIRNFFTTDTPTLTWGRLSWATGYEVEWSDTNAFNISDTYYNQQQFQANTLSTTTDPLPDGTYFWRVRAQKPDGTWSDWSIVDPFTVKTQ